MAIQAAGEGNIENKGSQLTGAMWDDERAIFLYGDWVAPDPEEFWEKELRKLRHLSEIETKLGGRPAISFMIEIGKEYGSGMLAVELAYQCAIRWPCVVLADTWNPVEGDSISTIYTKGDIERLRAGRTTFTTTVPIMMNNEE